METLACRHPPWPDLPDHLLEDILERLPLSGYVRFAAVCRRWRSAQTSHRRRHSPSPPPMLRLPWIISNPPRETLACYSPLEDESFTIPLPSPVRSLNLHPSADGWLLDDNPRKLILFNPISGAKIQLPPWFSSAVYIGHCDIAISPPPNYIVSIVESSSISLLRWFDSAWIQLEAPPGGEPWRNMTSCRGKHYFLCSRGESSSRDLLVVDALAAPPTFHYFEMVEFREMAVETGRVYWNTHLVEFDGEPLLVNEVVKHDKNWGEATVEFELFRADLSGKMWVRVDNIGDRLILLHENSPVSFLAADFGARGNCIYFARGVCSWPRNGRAPWKVFDLGTGRVTDLPLPNASRLGNGYRWLFVPSLC